MAYRFYTESGFLMKTVHTLKEAEFIYLKTGINYKIERID